jgi:hypothetical protein
MVSWPHSFWPVARQCIVEGSIGRAELLISWPKNKGEEGQGVRVPASPSRAHPH